MDWYVVFVVLGVGWLATLVNVTTGSCPKLPEGCQCGHPKHKDRIVCRNSTWTSFGHLNLTTVPENFTYLSLTETGVTRLTNDFSEHLPPSITKLNLSNNKINKIEEDAFLYLSKLEKLDLSYNSLNTLSQEAFNGLNSLKKLDLQGNLLLCDCHLAWIFEWTRGKNVKITAKSTCHFPAQLRGVPIIKKSEKTDFHCDWPVQLPVFEMSPSSNQLSFAGDPILFQCNVSIIDEDTQVTWSLDGHRLLPHDPEEPELESVSKENLILSRADNILVSSLHISQLNVNHSGFWVCHVATSRGNLSRSVKLVVVAKMAPFCPEIITWGNKGKYHWPQTLAGIVTDLPCAAPPPYGYQPSRAFHTCSLEGQWEALDLSSCPYVSEVTLLLEHFAKVNLTDSQTIVDTARGLRNYTGNGTSLTDVMDVIFITRTLEKYLNFVPQHKELGEILLGVINIVMNVEPNLLIEAQVQANACSRLTRIVDSLPEMLGDSAVNSYNDKLIVEEYLIKSEMFPGIRCSTFKDNLNDRIFHKWNHHCISVNSTVMLKAEKGVQASIYIPPSVLQSQSWQESRSPLPPSPWGHIHKLQFALYYSSALFPRYPPTTTTAVTSPVISCIAAYLPFGNLSQPVEVTLQIPVYTPDIKPVYWDRTIHDGKGDWRSSDCQLLAVLENRVTFSCPFFGTFGVLQNLEAMKMELQYQEAQFRLLHPAVYAGSFLALAGLITSIVLYIKQWRQMQMNRNNKHSLLNTWLALSLLLLVFTLGLPQTDFDNLCQVVGLLLHYLTLCTLTWMVITINNLYKSLSQMEKSEYETNDEDDEPPDSSVPPKPILRFYLVGWGVSSIVCGISASVQIEQYKGHNFCFLSQSSSLAALYGPVAILLLLILIYLLFIRCFLVSRSEMSGLPIVAQNGKSPSFDTHSIIDLEFSSATLLKLHTITLLLFALSWVSAGLAVSRPFSQLLPLDDLICSLIYCLFSFLLGLFVFFSFCYARDDVRKCLNRPVVKIVEEIELERNTEEPVETTCRDVAEEPPREEPNKVVINQVRDAVEKPSNVNLLVNHNPPTEVLPTGSMELFYNPRQSIVARKFFEKNRRQQQLKMLHKNNLEKEAAINGSGVIGRARAYSDTEHATSGASGERSFLCTSQSYGGPSAHQAELKALVHSSDQPKSSGLAPVPAATQFYSFPVSKDNCGLPPWMVGVPCARSSCSECSNCTKPPLSVYSYSDITSVSQRGNRRRPQSRNYGKYQKTHQYSWDDKYGNCTNKVFSQPLQEGPATTGHAHRKNRRKVGSRNSVHLSSTPERVSSKKAFSRSQSTNDHIGKHRVLLSEGQEMNVQDNVEQPT